MRRTWILVAIVAMIVGLLAAPASAGKGGKPGPPSGLAISVSTEGYMWANSVGDEILFDITVANTSKQDLTGIAVTWDSNPVATFDLATNASWSFTYPYSVVESDLSNAFVNAQDSIPVATVKAEAGSINDSEDAVMTVYPVPACGNLSDPWGSPPDLADVVFTTTEDYAVCAFTVQLGTAWKVTTKLGTKPRGKSQNPSATIRDGVPGNWCDYASDPPYQVGGDWYVDAFMEFPADGVCLRGGMNGETIPVRNHTIFYLATWSGNVVTATRLP